MSRYIILPSNNLNIRKYYRIDTRDIKEFSIEFRSDYLRFIINDLCRIDLAYKVYSEKLTSEYTNPIFVLSNIINAYENSKTRLEITDELKHTVCNINIENVDKITMESLRTIYYLFSR